MNEHKDTGTGWPDPAELEAHPAEPDSTGAEGREPDIADLDGAEPDPEADIVETDAAEPDPGGPAAGGQLDGAGAERPREPREWDVDGTDQAAPEPSTGAATTARRRVSATGALIGVLLILLGFAFVAQLRSHATDPALATARPEDLVRILSDLDARKDRLSQEIGQLRTTQHQLTAGSQGPGGALEAAANRARDLRL